MPNRKTAEVGRPPIAPTAAELRALLAHLLGGAAGGTENRWFGLIGNVEVLPVALHPTCNWKIEPNGKWREVEAIWKAVEVVRAAHPYVRS